MAASNAEVMLVGVSNAARARIGLLLGVSARSAQKVACVATPQGMAGAIAELAGLALAELRIASVLNAM